jgi:hypothetical protein
MYGIVNQAIQGLVTENFGAEAWKKIREKSLLTEENFLSNQIYDDSITYQLATAASEILELPLSTILIAFGEYWILKTGKEKYGSLMKAGGNNFREFLVNLPNFHSRVMLMYPKITPPEFKVTDETEHSLQLHYFSIREGLKHFMYGLIQGLAKLYQTEVQIEIICDREMGNDHETFLVKW